MAKTKIINCLRLGLITALAVGASMTAAEWQGYWGGQSIYPGTENFERGRWEERPICYALRDTPAHAWTVTEKTVARVAIEEWLKTPFSPLTGLVFENTAMACNGRPVDVVIRWEDEGFFRDWGDPNADGLSLDLTRTIGLYVPWRVAPPLKIEPCADLRAARAVDRCSYVVLNIRNPVGWFIDPTPERDEEFETRTATLCGKQQAVTKAKRGGPADGKQDLFTVIAHEFGHALGLVHSGGCDRNPYTGQTPDDDGQLMWEGFLTARRDLEDIVVGLSERRRPLPAESLALHSFVAPTALTTVDARLSDGGFCSAPTSFLSHASIASVQAQLVNCRDAQPLAKDTEVFFVFSARAHAKEIKTDADIESISLFVKDYQPVVLTSWSVLTITLPGPVPVTIRVIALGTVCLKPL